MEKTIEQKLPEIKELFIKYGAVSAYLFGSAAKNTLKKNSDIDFLFSFSPEIDFVTYSDNYFLLCEELENLLHKPVDLVAEKTLHNKYLIESINESKIRLL